MRIIIIGGGTAGMETAKTLRKLGSTDDIIILEKSAHVSVASCAIPDFLHKLELKPQELTSLSASEFEQELNLKIMLDTEVDSINTEQKVVHTQNRHQYHFDKLIIATGSQQLRPDIQGVLSDQVFTIKDLASAVRIKNFVQNTNAQKIVIIGASNLALETADSFCKICKNIAIITEDTPLLPMLSSNITTPLVKALKERQIALYDNAKIALFAEQNIRLENGIEIPYDIAIIARQTTPTVKIPILSELDIGETGGVIVNKYMQTSDKDIYAAGDNSELTDNITGLKMRPTQPSVAVKQAQIIASHILGEKKQLNFYTPYLETFVFDYVLGYFGATPTTLENSKTSYLTASVSGYAAEANGKFYTPITMNLYFDNNGKILGISGVGKYGISKRLSIFAVMISHGLTIYQLNNTELPYNFNFGELDDVVYQLGEQAQQILQQ